MTSQTTARNVTQQAGESFRAEGTIINANTGIYTVPIGKRARATDIQGLLDTVGADLTNSIAIKRFIGGAFDPLTVPKGVGVDQSVALVTMESQDILTNIGDSGATNAKFLLAATIEEFSK